ncbi:MAG: hypothetical protein ACJAVK_001204 [Akkermansiaceae bacterium]|jgi:hypothetical protein
MFVILNFFCALSFIGYGASCLAASHMVREFERFGLPNYRKLTGILQLLGAVGLLIGFRFPTIGALAAGGLSLQMLLGFGVRLKIRDRFLQCLPAFAFLLINAWLCIQFLGLSVK